MKRNSFHFNTGRERERDRDKARHFKQRIRANIKTAHSLLNYIQRHEGSFER
jgi:hypothetical protein